MDHAAVPENTVAALWQTIFVTTASGDKTVVFKLCITCTIAEGSTSQHVNICIGFVGRVSQLKSTSYYLTICVGLLVCIRI